MGNTVSSKVNNDVILRETSEYPVVVYSKPNCTYCKQAKNVLEENKIDYKENNLEQISQDNPDGYQAYVNGLVYTTRQTTVPQIFICGKFVGGFTELNNLQNAGKLLDAVAECANATDAP